MNYNDKNIEQALRERILILDGAMGTLIQSKALRESDYATGPFAGWPVALKGDNDVLNLTRPDVIRAIHRSYIEAGSDVITTNTFNCTRISQQEYSCQEQVGAMALAGARLAREAADAAGRTVWVAGSLGPTSKSLSLPSDVNVPESRAASFDEMASCYRETVRALRKGGVDVLLLETCYDALNAKAALYAISQVDEELGCRIPVMLSVTVNDRSGRTLTGQTLAAFYCSVSHYPLLSFGLNCSFGVTELRPLVERLAATVPAFISLYPNAGLPNAMGDYDETPCYTARHIEDMAQAGLLNLAGGCCGTTPEHIAHIARALRGVKPHVPCREQEHLVVSGLETVTVDKAVTNLVNVGERTNVAGSRKFARLIAAGNLDEALRVARDQIENGASIIDINMDDAMLDSRQHMRRFVRCTASDPAVARAALMIDSSDWDTIVEGLKNAQGKCIVNSISLKEGEQAFLAKARELRRLGAAVVVMAFDERGQATCLERKVEICRRAYDLLTQQVHFPAHDIIFDVNVLSVGTGIEAHARYAVDFIEAVRWIKAHLPGALTSGGVSNLSFAFRGNTVVRQAMHSVFLYHAIQAGLDMAIINPGMIQVYDEIEPRLLKAVEDVILDRRSDATEALIALAQEIKSQGQETASHESTVAAQWRSGSVDERLAHALVKGVSDYLAVDVAQALEQCGGNAVQVIEGPLMAGMERVGQYFGEGKMFLPQVVKSAKVMKQAVALLQPELEKLNSGNSLVGKPRIVLATVKGDVHDIGKNIVSIVLACNNFEVIDLGVMVDNTTILAAARRYEPVLVGVSGLITPSLKEMENLCRLFEREGMRVPIFVGGATTSAVHTAVKLAPLYSGGVIYGGDASSTSVFAKKYLAHPAQELAVLRQRQQQLRHVYAASHKMALMPYGQACASAPRLEAVQCYPRRREVPLQVSIEQVEPLIDWHMLLHYWGFKPGQESSEQARSTLAAARQQLEQVKRDSSIALRAVVKYYDACRQGNDIVLDNGTRLPMLRAQSGKCESLADFFPEQGTAPIGLFCVTAVDQLREGDPKDFEHLMQQGLAARLAEAAAQWLQEQLYKPGDVVIRPAFGYATCPDHSLKAVVVDALDARELLGLSLTESYMIVPATSVCGLLVAHPEAHYFAVGKIDRDQLADYARRRRLPVEEVEKLLINNVQ